MTPDEVYLDTVSARYYNTLNKSLEETNVYNNLKSIVPKLESFAEASNDAHNIAKYISGGKANFLTAAISNGVTRLNENAKEKIQTIVIENIKSQKPNIPELSIMDRTAYAIFLTSPDIQKIMKGNTEFEAIRNQYLQSIAGSNSEETKKYLDIISNQQKVQTDRIIDIDLVSRGIKFNLETIDNQLKNSDEKAKLNATDIKNKLENLGITVDDKLLNLVQSNIEIQKNVDQIYDLITNYISEKNTQQEKKEIAVKIALASRGFSFLGSVGERYNNKTLISVGVTGENLLNIYTSYQSIKESYELSKKLSLLTGNNPTIFSLDNIANFANIFSAIMTIGSLFKKNNQSESQMMMDAIKKLSETIYAMRREMHERFDRIEEIMGKMFTYLMSEFCEVHISGYRIERMLEMILMKMEMSEDLLRSSLIKISSQLTEIGNLTTIAERQKTILNLSEKIGIITGPHSIGLEKFKELFNQLRIESCENSRNNIFLVGNKYSSISEQVILFRNTDPSFNISLVQLAVAPASRDAVANPQVWSWATLAFMLLIEMRYKINGTGKRLSKPEWDEIGKFIEIGAITANFLNYLNSNDVTEGIKVKIAEAESAYNSLIAQFQVEQETIHSNERIALWERDFDKHDKLLRDTYQNTYIPINPDAVTNKSLYYDAGNTWFRNIDGTGAFCGSVEWRQSIGIAGYLRTFTTRIVAHVQGGKGRWYAEHYWGGYKGYDCASRVTNYKNACETEIATLKKAYIDQYRNTIFNKPGQLRQLSFHYDLASEIDTLFPVCVMIPEQSGMPYLSTPNGFAPPIQHIARELEAICIGRYIVKYKIENSGFYITVCLQIDDKYIPLLSGECPYKAPVSSGLEAVYRFWENGTYSTEEVGWEYWETNPGHRQENYAIVPIRRYKEGRRMLPFGMNNALSAENEQFLNQTLENYKLHEKSKFNTKLYNIITGTDMPLAQAYIQLQYWKLIQTAVNGLKNQREIFDITLRRLQYIQTKYADIIGDNDAAMEENLLQENKLLRKAIQTAGNVLNNVLRPEDRDRVIKVFMETMRNEGLIGI